MNKLYKIETEKYGYGEYDWFIICAENEIEAENIMIKGNQFYLWDFKESEFIEIGTPTEDLEKWIVLSSFNAW